MKLLLSIFLFLNSLMSQGALIDAITIQGMKKKNGYQDSKFQEIEDSFGQVYLMPKRSLPKDSSVFTVELRTKEYKEVRSYCLKSVGKAHQKKCLPKL